MIFRRLSFSTAEIPKGTKMTSKIKALVSADMIFLLLLLFSGSSSGPASEILYYSAFIVPTALILSFTYNPPESLHASARPEKSEVINDFKKDFSVSRRTLLFSLPVIAPTILIVLGISALTSLLMGKLGIDNTVTLETTLLIAIITHALIPAVLEELLFRLAPIKLLRGNKKTALILSAVMFAFAHANLFQIPFALVAGFACGTLYVVTGSILPSILLHFINNTVSLLSMYGFGDLKIILTLSVLSLASVIFIFVYRRTFIKMIKDSFDNEKFESSYHPLIFIITSLILAISTFFA